MKLILYKNKAESNRLDKSDYLEKIYELDGTLRDKCSIISPIIQVQLVELTKICQCNYAYIADFGRYYYIDDVVGEYNSIVTLYMRSDPLMSFKKPILDLDVVALRNEYNYSYKLVDEKLPSKCDVNIKRLYGHFDRPKGELNYVITYATISDINTTDKGVLSNGSQILVVNRAFINHLIKFTNGDDTYKELLPNIWAEKSMYQSEPWESIIGIKALPFSLDSLIDEGILEEYPVYSSTPGSVVHSIMIGKNKIFGFGASSKCYKLSETYCSNEYNICIEKGNDAYISFENFNFDDIDFINYAPYTKTSLFIPYYGFEDIDSYILSKFAGIRIEYYINLITCSCDIVLVCYTLTGLLYKYKILSTNIGGDVYITQTNSNQKEFKRTIATIGAITNGLSLGANYVSGINATNRAVSSNKLTSKYKNLSRGEKSALTRNIKSSGLAENNENLISSAINYAGNTTIDFMSANLDKFSAGHSSSEVISWISCRESPFIICTVVPIADYGRTTNYAHLIGRPSEYSGRLGDLYGYTEICGVHIEFNQLNFTPLVDEIEEIENTMRSGIILPDKPAS